MTSRAAVLGLVLVLAAPLCAQDRNGTPDRTDRTGTPDRTGERGGRRLNRDSEHGPARVEPEPPPAIESDSTRPKVTNDTPPEPVQPNTGPDAPPDRPPRERPQREPQPERAYINSGDSTPTVREREVREHPVVTDNPIDAGEVLAPDHMRRRDTATVTETEWKGRYYMPPAPSHFDGNGGGASEPETPSRRARRAAGRLARARLARVAPGEASLLDRLTDEVIVVPGDMDNLEEVLDNASIPYRTVFAASFATVKPLDPLKTIVMVNCPGEGFDAAGLARLTKFVKAGGWLVTTDWAIRGVLEKAFPGIIRAGAKDTDEEAVEVRMQDTTHPFLAGIFDPDRPPTWTLDLDSFPIEILKPRAVRVLLNSPAMKAKYGHDTVGVVFEQDKGQVFHLTSHFCLQRAPSSGPLAKTPATKYLDDEISGADVPPQAADEVRADLAGVTAAELEAHYTATKLIANVIVEHVRRAHAMAPPKKK